MSEPCVIRADYANWRPVSGRKILQLILEVPIEQTQDVMLKLGVPVPGESKWVAVALLQPVAEGQAEQSEAAPPKKQWSEYTRSQQAAILIQDPEFCSYFKAANPINCDGKLKLHFRIASKRELDDEINHAGWDEFVALYHMHRDRTRYAGSKR